MREDVIVHVKREVHSDDEEEIDPSAMPESTSNGITAEISASTTQLNLENSLASTHHLSFPCGVCGRLFDASEELSEHVKNEHADQMFQEIVGRIDEGLRAKVAAFQQQQQQQRLLALLQNGAAATGLLQQPAAAAALLQLLGISAPVKTEMPKMPSIPMVNRSAVKTEKPTSPYESRRAFPGRPRHPVWSLFLRIDKFDAECTICKSRVRSACPTNLCRHLNNNHCELASQLFVKWKKQKEDLGGSFPPLESRANRHKSTSTSSTSSSLSSSSVPVATVITPSFPGFPHLPLVMEQQAMLLKQKEQAATLSQDVLKAINDQLQLNYKILAQAQRTFGTAQQIASAFRRPTIRPKSPLRQGVIQFGGTERQDSDDSLARPESPIDILSISPDLDALIDEAAKSAATRRPYSAPPPSNSAAPTVRPTSAPSMIALMDGSSAGYEMYGYQDVQHQQSGQQQPALMQQQEPDGEAVAALRQPSQQTLESWFATAYNQPLQLEAATVMNAGAYGTVAPTMDAAGLAATVTESANFPIDIKNVQLFADDQHQLFAASSSTTADQHQQQHQFQDNGVKQEVTMDEQADDSQRPSVFQTAPPNISVMQHMQGPPAKRGRPTENPCWDNFERMDDTQVKCHICERVVKSACATNMTKHLERHHPEEHQILLQKIRYSRQFKPPVPTPGTASTPTSSSQQQQFATSTMALNHIAHQPQHHLLQPMASDLGQPIGHHLPMSPDQSPAGAHCLISTQHHFLKDPSTIRPEMLLLPHDGLISNMDPNSYHVPPDFYQSMQFDNSLFDNASQWQQRHFPVTSTGYDQWMGDQSASAMLINDDWNQSAAAAAAAQQQQLEQLQMQQNSVIQSVVAGAATTDVLDAAALAAAAAVVASDTSSTSSTTSNSSTTAVGGLCGMQRQPHEGKPYMKRNRKTEHPVWEFFKRTADGNAQCSICSGIVKSPCSSNFMRHLMRHHSAEYSAVYTKWSNKRGPTMKSSSASF